MGVRSSSEHNLTQGVARPASRSVDYLIISYFIKCLNISGARIAPRDQEAELSQSPPARPRTAPHRSPTRPNYREEVSGK